MRSRHDLLRVHHLQGVSAQDDLAAEQPRQAHIPRCGADRVAHVRVNMEVRARCRQLCRHRHSNAAIDRLVSYRFGGRGLNVEDDPVVECDRGDLARRRAGRPRVVLECLCLQVDVACWSALVEGRQQDSALQHEPLGESRARQPGEERLQDVELQQLVDGALALARELTQVEVCATGCAGPSRSTHSRTSSALRIACSAPAKCLASSMS